jgi:hypothetical protein
MLVGTWIVRIQAAACMYRESHMLDEKVPV